MILFQLILSRYLPGDSIEFEEIPSGATGTFDINPLAADLDVATSTMNINQTLSGSGFTDLGGDYAFFPTRNLDEPVTTVDIVANASGQVIGVTITDLGARAKYGDYFLVEAGDSNFVFQYTPEIDVPAPWQRFTNMRAATPDEWNSYRTVMQSSVNLLDKSLITNVGNMYPNYFNISWYWLGDGGVDIPATNYII